MTKPPHLLRDWTLVQDVVELAAVVDRASGATTIGIDVEANGLFVYRPRLCTVQLAWEEGERTSIAVIDTLRVDIAALAPLFSATVPIKVLHDLTFDARMLHEHGAPIQNVRDTSVAARLLGLKATGLASVLATELGIVLDKRFQQHDWSRRPLDPAHLDYLANDVAHLLRLDRALMEKIAALDIGAEVEAECAYKLVTALARPRDQRPAYARIKGVQQLDRTGRAVLMHLVAAREDVAERVDVPPFKVIANEVLLELARRRPRSMTDLGRIRGASSGRAGRYVARWIEAIAAGIDAGDVPESDRMLFDPPPFDRQAAMRRREIESKLSAFRRAEAQRRGVDEQVVLPGHCVHELAAILASTSARDSELATRIAAVSGIGAKRAEQYGSALVSLLDTQANAESAFMSDEHDDEPAW
ncbi:MAG: HRDC domain-containing protein [Polyangiaceae bacterium]|nr:HRDC domain-containing protein [Polyangiaceae bacterium]